MKVDMRSGELHSLLENIHLENDLKSNTFNNQDTIGTRVRINISGTIFETYRKTLTRKDDSIFNIGNVSNYYDPLKQEYYFDRNPKAFEAILTFMQCGILSLPPKVPNNVFIEELQFFGFERQALKVIKDGQVNVKENVKKVSHTDRNSILGKIWQLLEDPENCVWSKTVTSLSMFVVLLAVCLFSVDTLPEVRGTTGAVVIKQLEYFCVTWFTIEITLRFISSPIKNRFLMDAMNVIDIISLVPYYLEIFLISKSYTKVVLSSTRVLRIARIFNLLKLYRYSRAIQVMTKTLYSSVAELLMLLCFLAIGTMVFAPVLYYFEFDGEPDSQFQSIPQTFWLCIVTTSTVGFGDVVPLTAGGKIAVTMLSISSIILLTLLIPIIGRNFLIFYEQYFPSEKPEKTKTFDTDEEEVEEEIFVERETIL